MIIDSHCHIDFSDFDSDRPQVIQRAIDENITKIIVPGVTKKNWKKISDLCSQYTQLLPCFGLHPYFIDQHQELYLTDLESYIEKNKPVAIGECGLDYFLKNLDKNKQLFYFEKQMQIATNNNLPIVLHARKSTEDIIKTIKKFPGISGMIHSFSGSFQQAKQLIDLNFYLSFGGPITYNGSTRLHKLITQIPLDSILVETDSPDQVVANKKTSRNEPAFIIDVIEQVSKLKNIDIHVVSNTTTKNAMNCFNL